MMAKDLADDYFSRLGFEQDPFAEDYDADTYFLTPELQHRLELLKHLLEFSQQILLVKGPQRSGKSWFVQHLVNSLEENWAISQVQADMLSGPDSLIKKILGERAEEIYEGGETISALTQYLVYCNNRSLMPVVVIDDATSLAKETLAFLFQLIKFREEETFIRVVIIGENTLADALNAAASAKSESDLVHEVSLPAYSLEQTADYLASRLGRNYSAKEMISDREIQRIHKVAAGIVGDINFLAKQGLIDPARGSERAERKARTAEDTGGKISLLKIIMAAVLVATIFIFFFYLKGGAQKTEEPKTLSLQLPSAEERKLTVSVVEPKQAEQAFPPDSWMEKNEEKIAELQAPAQQPAQPQKPIEPPVAPEQSQTAPPLPEKVQPEAVPAEVTAPAPAKSSGMRDAEWLQSRSSSQYVLQLLGALEKPTVLGFIKDTGLDKQKLALYVTKKADRDWYVLVYGIFEDIEAARAAVANLPARVKSEKPWPKSIAAVKQELQNR